MTQIYQHSNSTELARIDERNKPTPTIVDKHQARRLYRLQRPPNVNTSLHLDNSDSSYETQGYFENSVRKQGNGSFGQPGRTVYRRPTDMSDKSMARFLLGKARLDPQRMIPSEMTTVRNHPSAMNMLRYDESSNNTGVPCFTDRLVSDRIIRSRLGPGGTSSPNKDCEQTGNYLRNQEPHDTLDSRLPSKLSVPLTTYEANGSDPILKSQSFPSLHDARTFDILNWDRVQLRNVRYYEKPIANIAPLPRAQQISGYSGSIGGYNIQDIDNPTVGFQPYTVLRTEMPKFSMNSIKPNMLSYTGNTHWSKVDPVSHYDRYGDAYTTTAACHIPLPLDNSSYRHTGFYGLFSKSVTNVRPNNPYNRMDNNSETSNGSLDSRPHLILRHLPRRKLSPPIKNKKKVEQNINNEVKS